MEWLVTSVLGVIGLGVTGLFGWLATRVTAKSTVDAARGPDWQGFTDKIMEAQERQLKERDRRIGALESKVEKMRGALEAIEGKYRHSIRHIMAWRRAFPDGGPPVPEAIREDLEN